MGFLSGVIGAATGFLTGGPAGAVIGGVGGLLGSKEKDKAQKSSDKYNNQSLSLQEAQLRIAQDRQKDYDLQYKPLEDQYLKQVKEGVTADYATATNDAIGDVNSQFAGAEAARLRTMQRTGVNPNSGRADALGRNLSLSRALATTGTINNARRAETNRAEDLTFARTQDALNTGVNKLNNAQASAQTASTALSQTYANRATQLAADGTNAANNYADLGSTIFQAWDKYKSGSTGGKNTGVWF